uniref:Uncharacterized protein n=1 Tax=Rangifer tarandus platyrhynchus TaxID=3082113 RepID=A0ACB0E7Z4_RANTA|nr:unnamed protein product [Rangifer tarandus platyrhynchus]
MTNQRAGAAVLKGGLLQRYQLQARVCGAEQGREGPCAAHAARPPPAAPRLSLRFVWLPPGGMGTHRGSGDLPGANVSITRPPGCVATSSPGGAFGRSAVQMASDARRSRFSRMEPAPSLSPAQAPWAGVDAMRSIFGRFPSWEQCRVVPGQADSGVLSRRARGAAPGE